MTDKSRGSGACSAIKADQIGKILSSCRVFPCFCISFVYIFVSEKKNKKKYIYEKGIFIVDVGFSASIHCAGG
jgi:hypothetical protein